LSFGGTASVDVRACKVDSGDRLLRRGSIFWYNESGFRSGDAEREFSREWTGESRIDGRRGLVRLVAIPNGRLYSSESIFTGRRLGVCDQARAGIRKMEVGTMQQAGEESTVEPAC
jgi:hypothetical protein